MTVSVQKIGANTVSVTDGQNTWVLDDKNGDGQIDSGDVVTEVAQNYAAVSSWAVGESDTKMIAGDPHIYDRTLTDAQKTLITANANQIFHDASNGTLSGAELTGLEASADLTSVNFALPSSDNGLQLVTSVQSNFTLRDDGVDIHAKVVQVGAVAVTNAIDLQVQDANGSTRTVSISGIYAPAQNGAGMSVADTTGNTPAQAFTAADAGAPLVVAREGVNVQIGTMLFGASSGKTGTAVDTSGHVNFGLGKQSLNTIQYYDAFILGHNPALAQALELAEQAPTATTPTDTVAGGTEATTQTSGLDLTGLDASALDAMHDALREKQSPTTAASSSSQAKAPASTTAATNTLTAAV